MTDKYFLFGSGRYYPGGGTRDFQGVFDTVKGAKEAWHLLDKRWYGHSSDQWAEIVIFVDGERFERVTTFSSEEGWQ